MGGCVIDEAQGEVQHVLLDRSQVCVCLCVAVGVYVMDEVTGGSAACAAVQVTGSVYVLGEVCVAVCGCE
jgi:hypothetical protein